MTFQLIFYLVIFVYPLIKMLDPFNHLIFSSVDMSHKFFIDKWWGCHGTIHWRELRRHCRIHFKSMNDPWESFSKYFSLLIKIRWRSVLNNSTLINYSYAQTGNRYIYKEGHTHWIGRVLILVRNRRFYKLFVVVEIYPLKQLNGCFQLICWNCDTELHDKNLVTRAMTSAERDMAFLDFIEHGPCCWLVYI